MNLSNRASLSRRNKVLATLLLVALAVLGNYLNLPLFFGVDFIFGSIAVMLAVLLLGPVAAVVVAVAGGLYTLVLWGHYYALITFSLEALVVGLLYRQGMRNLVLADILFWLLLGMPMVLLFYIGLLGMDIQSSILVAFKQGVNAWFNTLLAGSLLTVWQLFAKKRRVLFAPVALSTLLFQSMLLVTLLAGVVPIVHESYSQQKTQESFIKLQLEERTARLAQRLRDDYLSGQQRLDYHLQSIVEQSDIRMVILGQDGSVVAQRGDIDALPGTGDMQPGLQIWLPQGEMSAMQRWKRGLYRLSLPVDAGPQLAQVQAFLPAANMVLTLEKQRLELFVMLALIFLLAAVLAYGLSRLVSQPLVQLQSVAKNMAGRVMTAAKVSMPVMQVKEYASLADSMDKMNVELSDKVMQLQQVRIGLEHEVSLRTKDLTHRTSELQAVLAAASEFAIIATDRQGVIRLFNPGAEKMLGYGADELIGVQTPALFHLPEEVAARATELSRACNQPIDGFRTFVELAERNGFETREWTYQRKDGKAIPVSLTITPQYDEQGCIIGYLGIAEDITGRKLAEQALRQFKSTLDQTLDCVFMFDADEMHFFYANEGALNQVGYNLDELFSMHPFDIKPQINEAQFRDIVAPLIAGEQDSLTFETVHKHKQGNCIPVEIFLQYMAPKGESTRFVAIVRDITERKKTEMALAEQAQHTQTVVDNMVDGIITIDYSGIIQSFNPAAVHIFGYDVAEVLGKNVNMLMPGPHAEAHDSYLRNYRATGVARIIGIGREVEGKCKTGALFPMELAISEITRNGQPMYVGMVRDISERKRMERMKNEFVSTVSHELRTPLTSIVGALDMIATGKLGALSEPVQQMLNIAHNNSKRLTYLITDLLDLEKLAAGKLNFDMQYQPLQPLVQLALDSHQTYSAQRQIKLALENSNSDVQVRVDSQRLQQVLANLLSNAIKFSPENSTIQLRVKTRADVVRIEVQDQGPGIPEAFRCRIFERFAQADSSDTRKIGGTGLGLAITRELVERMRGRIGFSSTEGQGSTFWFELPLAQPQRNRPVDDSPAGADLYAARILVVEDEPDVAEILLALLVRSGYDADIAYTGEQALTMLKEHHYDLMCLDLMLPDISGLNIIQRVRAQSDTKELPIVVVSAKMEQGRLALNGGVNGIEWLAKPFEEQYLLSVVTKLLPDQNKSLQSILHVEDDVDLYHVIVSMAERGYHFEHAGTLQEARNKMAQQHFDVIILDIGLPDGSGWTLLADIRQQLPDARVVILSGNDISVQEAKMVESVLLKSQISTRQLLDALTKNIHYKSLRS